MLQAATEKLRKFLNRLRYLNLHEIRNLSRKGQFREVAEAFEAGQIKNAPAAYDTIGYCYYQLANYPKAVHFLGLADENYYSKFFLALSLSALNKKPEAIQQLLKCLKKYVGHTNEILDHLLPNILDLNEERTQQEFFRELNLAIQSVASSPLHKAKVLFYQKKDDEILHDRSLSVEVRVFHSAKHLADRSLCKYTELEPQEKLRFVNINDQGEILVDLLRPYFAEVPSALLVSGTSLVFLNNNQLALSDLLADPKYGISVDTSYDKVMLGRRNDAVLIKRYTPDFEIPMGVMLCGLASAAYGHWFAEFIPKLRFFEKHPEFSTMPIIVDDGMPQAHYDFLRAMVKNPLFILPNGKSVRVERLLAAPTDVFFPTELKRNHSVPPEHQGSLTIGALKYIDKRARSYFGDPAANNSRIFLSRRNSTWRRLINEQELIEDLKKMNFEVVYCEDLSFAEQVSVFQKASCIVAPNGSALNNLIFSHPTVKILLLGQSNLFNWGGWFGSFMELGYDPQYLAGEAVGRKEEKHSDYMVSRDVLIEKVKEMLDAH